MISVSARVVRLSPLRTRMGRIVLFAAA